ncbi:MAG: DNA polymerase III subunit gamma/tau [Spirochaetales bacterium]|nr:DNA polymerase III subunit gamma/tau [Spirochaetales bacterium]
MAFKVTATKKRPQLFDELAGQEFVVSTLKSSLTRDRIAHAYLFSGPRGVGKTSAARILARAVNCQEGPTATPCGVCSSCQEIARGRSLDVIEIDGASNTSVNDIRQIRDEVLFAPNSSRYKVYIIDEVHMLSNSAFNALLKTIEEPPPYIVFIFATTEIHKVPATIRSRCQQFTFRLISIDGIKKKLYQAAEDLKVSVEDEALFWIAKESTGSMRDAYTLFDQIVSFSENEVTLALIKEKLGIVGIDELSSIVREIAEGNGKKVLEYTDSVLEKGISIEQFVINLTEYFRNLLFLKYGIKKDYILGYSVDTFPGDIIDAFPISHLESAMELLLELYRTFRFSISQKFELELLMSRLASLKKLITRQELLEELKQIKSDILEGPRNLQSETTISDEISESPHETSVEKDSNILVNLIQYLHTEKKIALVSALEKVESWDLKDDEFTLVFNTHNKFAGELLKKEKTTLSNILSESFGLSVKILISFNKVDQDDQEQKDQRVEILKNIFQGEIVEGKE